MVNSRFPDYLRVGKSGKSGVGVERSLASLGGWCLGSMGLKDGRAGGSVGVEGLPAVGRDTPPGGAPGPQAGQAVMTYSRIPGS